MSERLPATLHEVVIHARRLERALDREDHDLYASPHSNPRALTDAERWIIGRAGEVDAFVNDVLREYRANARSVDDATALIAGFIATVHDGFALAFGRAMTECCASGGDSSRFEATTIPARPVFESLRKNARQFKAVSIASGASTPTPPN